MIKKNTLVSLMTVALMVSACSGDDTNEGTKAAEHPAAHKKVAAAITQGFAALNDKDAQGLSDAGDQLVKLSARPLGETPDLAETWSASDTGTIPMRGRVRGPGYRVKDLPNGQSDTFTEIFYGIEEAVISVTGDGQYRINVLDEEGRPPLCMDETVCRFTPDVTAPYRIIISNAGTAGRYIFVAD